MTADEPQWPEPGSYPGLIVKDPLYGYTLIGLDGIGLPGAYDTCDEAEKALEDHRAAAARSGRV